MGKTTSIKGALLETGELTVESMEEYVSQGVPAVYRRPDVLRAMSQHFLVQVLQRRMAWRTVVPAQGKNGTALCRGNLGTEQKEVK